MTLKRVAVRLHRRHDTGELFQYACEKIAFTEDRVRQQQMQFQIKDEEVHKSRFCDIFQTLFCEKWFVLFSLKFLSFRSHVEGSCYWWLSDVCESKKSERAWFARRANAEQERERENRRLLCDRQCEAGGVGEMSSGRERLGAENSVPRYGQEGQETCQRARWDSQNRRSIQFQFKHVTEVYLKSFFILKKTKTKIKLVLWKYSWFRFVNVAAFWQTRKFNRCLATLRWSKVSRHVSSQVFNKK